MSSSPRGILRNRSESSSDSKNSDHFDRQEVVKNTRLNAQLYADSRGDEIRAKIAEQKSRKNSSTADHLKWDEINLYKTEQEKSSTMKIDEPKTPYQGGFNPEGEYYQEDDEIQNFQLGKGELGGGLNNGESLNGSVLIQAEESTGEEGDEEDNKDESEELTREERHKRFEEKRKAHYHLKGEAMKVHVPLSDDEN